MANSPIRERLRKQLSEIRYDLTRLEAHGSRWRNDFISEVIKHGKLEKRI
jgi:hypothetical protein